ncbi:MAG: ABC transporter ATP-binding protein [Paracoccus sp. (in: a-proteobacteria)]|nr:ABC transporter ATP-binding protein [Paracoccus sp. (in: a-proteobacteria)]
MRAHLSDLLVRGLYGNQAQVWLSPVLRRALPGIGVVLATSLVAALLALVPPWLTKQLIDLGLMAGDWGAIVRYALLGFAIGLMVLASGAINNLLHLHYSARMLAHLRLSALDAALHYNVARPALPVGEAMARIDGDTAQIQQFTFDVVLAAVSSLIRLIGGAVMLMVLDWRLALIPIAAAPLNLAFLVWARPRTQARATEVRDLRGEISSHLAEDFHGLPTLRSLGGQTMRLTGFAPLQNRQIAALMAQRRWGELVGAVPQITGALVRMAILLGGSLLILRGDWQIGSLIAFLAYVGMLTGPLHNLLGLYHAQAVARVALARLDAVMAPDMREAGGRPLPDGPGALRLSGARASMGRHLPVDAVISPGQRVLIDGPSGIGKSALAALAARLSPPAPGARVFLDGQDAAGLDPTSLRRAVTIVPQASVVFRGTLAENLRLAAPDATDADLAGALHDAGLDGLPLTTGIAEAGRNLSGGERQRIALARALLLRPKVLILDESLSEVDATTATRILVALDRRLAGRTIIVIAHAGPAREMTFGQVLTLRPDPLCRNARGDWPNQRENAREKAV